MLNYSCSTVRFTDESPFCFGLSFFYQFVAQLCLFKLLFISRIASFSTDCIILKIAAAVIYCNAFSKTQLPPDRISSRYSLANPQLYSCVNMLMESNKKELVIHAIKGSKVIIGKLIETLKNNQIVYLYTTLWFYHFKSHK